MPFWEARKSVFQEIFLNQRHQLSWRILYKRSLQLLLDTFTLSQLTRNVWLLSATFPTPNPGSYAHRVWIQPHVENPHPQFSQPRIMHLHAEKFGVLENFGAFIQHLFLDETPVVKSFKSPNGIRATNLSHEFHDLREILSTFFKQLPCFCECFFSLTLWHGSHLDDSNIPFFFLNVLFI